MSKQRLSKEVLSLYNKYGHIPIHKFEGTSENFTRKIIELREAKKVDVKDDGVIRAYYCIWGVPDDRNCVWEKGSWTRSINERGPNSNARNKIVVLAFHDQKDPIGLPSVLFEDEEGVYAEFTPDDVPSGKRIETQVRSGTINQFSFGFNYIWSEDAMYYNSTTETIHIREAVIYELSPVSIGSQGLTYAVRSADGTYKDETLSEEIEEFIKTVSKKDQLYLRSLFQRTSSLENINSLERERMALAQFREQKPAEIDFEYLINNINI